CIPADMIEVEMRAYDEIDIVGPESRGRESIEKGCFQAAPLGKRGALLGVPDACIHEHPDAVQYYDEGLYDGLHPSFAVGKARRKPGDLGQGLRLGRRDASLNDAARIDLMDRCQGCVADPPSGFWHSSEPLRSAGSFAQCTLRSPGMARY